MWDEGCINGQLGGSGKRVGGELYVLCVTSAETTDYFSMTLV